MEFLSRMKFTNYLNKSLYFILFLVLGLIFFIHPMLLSNFDSMMGDKISTLYNNYVLEHSFLWLVSSPLHESFWGAPFNYPDKNVLANADTLMGIAPIYWLIRAIVKNPFTSFQMLFVFLCVLNYSTFYYFLNKQLKFSNLSSAFASFVFAFGLIRYSRSFEIGYFSQFLTILAMIFLFKTSSKNTRIKNHIFYLLASLCLVLQCYTCFSLGFFALFVAFFALVFALVPKSSRDFVVKYLNEFWFFVIFYLFIIFVLLMPMAYHFSLTGEIKTLSYHLNSIYTALIWFKSVSFLDGIITAKIPFGAIDNFRDLNCSVGIFTMILAIFGILKAAKYRGFLIITLIFTYLTSCNEVARDFWRIFYFLIPSTEGLENINRVCFLALIIFALGCGYLVQFFEQNQIKNKIITKTLLVFALVLITFEHIPLNFDNNSYWRSYVLSKKEFQKEIDDLSSLIPDEAKVIEVKYKGQNESKYTKNNLKIKKINAQKYADLSSLYIGLKLGKYSKNSYFIKEESGCSGAEIVYKIIQTVDFDKI